MPHDTYIIAFASGSAGFFDAQRAATMCSLAGSRKVSGRLVYHKYVLMDPALQVFRCCVWLWGSPGGIRRMRGISNDDSSEGAGQGRPQNFLCIIRPSFHQVSCLFLASSFSCNGRCHVIFMPEATTPLSPEEAHRSEQKMPSSLHNLVRRLYGVSSSRAVCLVWSAQAFMRWWLLGG